MFLIVLENTSILKEMAESTRKQANKGHYLRNQKCDTLKIITDQNIYQNTTASVEEK